MRLDLTALFCDVAALRLFMHVVGWVPVGFLKTKDSAQIQSQQQQVGTRL